MTVISSSINKLLQAKKNGYIYSTCHAICYTDTNPRHNSKKYYEVTDGKVYKNTYNFELETWERKEINR